MAADQQQSVMRRKTQAGRALHQSRTVSVLKALRLTVSKVGNDLFSLPLAIIGATQEALESDACAASLADDHLLILLDGPDGARGAAMIDPVLVGGLIQQQTMGRVLPAQDGAARAMTGTDASLVAPIINTLLERAAVLPETDAEKAVLAGYRFGAKAADVRLLMLSLEAASFHLIRLTVDMAKGARQGELVFCLPVPRAAAPSPPDADSGGADPTAPPKTLAQAVMGAKAELLISLAQVSLTISQASALHVGQILDVGNVSFEDAKVRTRAGRILASGVLGQTNGMRAMRLKHRAPPKDIPRRRESDKQSLIRDGVYDMDFEARYSAETLPSLPEDTLSDQALVQGADGMYDIPDMSDLPGFEEETEASRTITG